MTRIANKEAEKIDEQINKTQESIKEVSDKIVNLPPPKEEDRHQIPKDKGANEIYLKPKRTMLNRDKFNEQFRSKYEHDKQYVRFIAENVEIKGERIEIWTRPFGGLPAELWEVPVNKPVWGPRYLAEQIKRKYYHRLIMEDKPISAEGGMTYYGSMAVDSIVHRMNAHPAPIADSQISFYQKVSSF